MKDFEETVEMLLKTMSNYQGSAPTIKIDYRNNEVHLVESSSGFIKALHDVGGFTHLDNGTLSVGFFYRDKPNEL
tara:strand:- start:3 stop:227 length:225 start_codon:yes stop_codon:yes gene_type:complete